MPLCVSVFAADRLLSVERLSQYLAENSVHREKARPTVHKLEKRIDMRTQGLSSTIALTGNVDLESAKKGMVSLGDRYLAQFS